MACTADKDKAPRREEAERRFVYHEPLWAIVADFLMDHPIVTFVVSLLLSASCAVLTTFLLVYLRMAGYIP